MKKIIQNSPINKIPKETLKKENNNSPQKTKPKSSFSFPYDCLD